MDIKKKVDKEFDRVNDCADKAAGDINKASGGRIKVTGKQLLVAAGVLVLLAVLYFKG